jgi:RHS repeat-associated protein
MFAQLDFPRRPVAASRRSPGHGPEHSLRRQAPCGFSRRQKRSTYDPYGKATVLDGNGTPRTVNESLYGNPWTFTGRRLDGETGLMYFRNRMYETGLGRFIGRDPIGYADGLGLYEYAVGSPNKYMDPRGTTVGEAANLATYLASKCKEKTCLARATCCTEKECIAEAITIATAAVNKFSQTRKPYFMHGDKTVQQGYKCYQWASFMFRELRGLPLKCWRISWVGTTVASGEGPLAQYPVTHNYVFASLGSPKSDQGPDRSCGVVIDAWNWAGGDPGKGGYDWDWLRNSKRPGSDKRMPGAVWKEGEWKEQEQDYRNQDDRDDPLKFPPGPPDPDHSKEEMNTGGYTPPSPVTQQEVWENVRNDPRFE